MRYGLNSNQEDDLKDFKQIIAGQSIRSIEDRQDEIQCAKNGFIGMLAGIVVAGVVGWLFLSPAGKTDKQKEIPVIRRSITPAKVQPNEPGGMEIDNQNREIYHIVDKLPKNNNDVKIIPAPEMSNLINDNTLNIPNNIESLVETIEESDITSSIREQTDEKVVLADKDLVGVKTNSRDKIVIPQKIKEIDFKVQNTVNSQVEKKEVAKKEQTVVEKKVAEPEPTTSKMAKGTWYTQIIASSSRQAVDNLWRQLSNKHPFLQAYPHEVEEITAANGSTLYRLKVGSFAQRKDAETLSNKLKQNQISSIIKQN